ncbi:Hypothetical protein SLIV_12882 [Streptomyces lividans TK24]|uniref:Secreted protein n=1 Tax=Streptomyces lividans TK24 TaxID=457428 RepID=A0ABX6TU39_STRLI|nr:Hypothetical protein SLIV_12882 [Streptomyces lividans TK24]QSJ09088.1 Hypothetical protein SLIVDG2_12882 [Streptomyces lividans]QTD70012.1 Hypothetical protein SLIVYQS_12882 [Streptomyces lividans TK24] [Streptomyces lividans]
MRIAVSLAGGARRVPRAAGTGSGGAR